MDTQIKEIKSLDDIQKANAELEEHLKIAEDIMREIKKIIPESGSGITPITTGKILLAIRKTREELHDFSKSQSLRKLKLVASVQKKYNLKYL